MAGFCWLWHWFKLEGTVADNYADYKTYYFAFHDKEENGLSFNPGSVKVYVDGVEITSGYEVKTTGLKHIWSGFWKFKSNFKCKG